MLIKLGNCLEFEITGSYAFVRVPDVFEGFLDMSGQGLTTWDWGPQPPPTPIEEWLGD